MKRHLRIINRPVQDKAIKKMIIVKLMQGLGNQLFQYATGRSVALRLNCPLKFDVTDYTRNGSRKFELHYFCYPQTIATNIREHFNEPFYVYDEPHFHFDKNCKKLQSNTYLRGFWQTQKYFIEQREQLLEDLTIKNEFVSDVKAKANEIANQNSACMHVRRGDYLSKPFIDSLGVLPIAYYEKALELLERRFSNPQIKVFSDDINWVKKNLSIKHEHEFISGYCTKNNIEDFYLMMNCKHHIIANSSFSWWAAWLNQYKEKLVIAPKKWFIGAHYNNKDVVPQSWIKI